MPEHVHGPPAIDGHCTYPKTPQRSSENAARQGWGIYILAEEGLQLEGLNPTESQTSEPWLAGEAGQGRQRVGISQQGTRGSRGPTLLANASHLIARAPAGSVWEMGHKWMSHRSSQEWHNFQAICRLEWPPFLSQQDGEGGGNHTKNLKKLGQFTNLSRCLQQLARAVRTNSLLSLLSIILAPSQIFSSWFGCQAGAIPPGSLQQIKSCMFCLLLLKPLSSSTTERNTAKN